MTSGSTAGAGSSKLWRFVKWWGFRILFGLGLAVLWAACVAVLAPRTRTRPARSRTGSATG